MFTLLINTIELSKQRSIIDPNSPSSLRYHQINRGLALTLAASILASSLQPALAQSNASARASAASQNSSSSSQSELSASSSCESLVQSTRNQRLVAFGWGATLGAVVGFRVAQSALADQVKQVEERIQKLTTEMSQERNLLEARQNTSAEKLRFSDLRQQRLQNHPNQIEPAARSFRESVSRVQTNLSTPRGDLVVDLSSSKAKQLIDELPGLERELHTLQVAASSYKAKLKELVDSFPTDSLRRRSILDQLGSFERKSDRLVNQAATLEKVVKEQHAALVRASEIHGVPTLESTRLNTRFVTASKNFQGELDAAKADLNSNLNLIKRASALEIARNQAQAIAERREVMAAKDRFETRTKAIGITKQIAEVNRAALRHAPKLIGAAVAIGTGGWANAAMLANEIKNAPSGAELNTSLREILLSPELLLNPDQSPADVCYYLEKAGPSVVSEAMQQLSEVKTYAASSENTHSFQITDRNIQRGGGPGLSAETVARQAAPPPQLVRQEARAAQ